MVRESVSGELALLRRRGNSQWVLLQRTGGKNVPGHQDGRSQGPEVQKAWLVPGGVTEPGCLERSEHHRWRGERRGQVMVCGQVPGAKGSQKRILSVKVMTSHELGNDHSAIEWKATRWQEWTWQDKHPRVPKALENHTHHTPPAGASFPVPWGCRADAILISIFLTIFPLCHFTPLAKNQRSAYLQVHTQGRGCVSCRDPAGTLSALLYLFSSLLRVVGL